jgi:hypothetical protein
MFEEEKHVDLDRPTERPPAFGYTVVLRPTRASPAEFLARFREVWCLVASWGRYLDEEAGEWPSDDTCMAALPKDFARAVQANWSVDVDGWLQDVHDRDWILWSASASGELVKIDLSADSMPISSWPLRFVAAVIGADVIYADTWKPDW